MEDCIISFLFDFLLNGFGVKNEGMTMSLLANFSSGRFLLAVAAFTASSYFLLAVGVHCFLHSRLIGKIRMCYEPEILFVSA